MLHITIASLFLRGTERKQRVTHHFCILGCFLIMLIFSHLVRLYHKNFSWRAIFHHSYLPVATLQTSKWWTISHFSPKPEEGLSQEAKLSFTLSLQNHLQPVLYFHLMEIEVWTYYILKSPNPICSWNHWKLWIMQPMEFKFYCSASIDSFDYEEVL
jgi:hypothetical protein